MTANLPVKSLFEVSNNMVRGDDSGKKGTQFSLIKNNCAFAMISLFLLNMLLLAGLRAKSTVGGNPAMD